MTDTTEPTRPVPFWVHAWSVLSLVATLTLLALGQMVTSFRAGMADPIWPTEPWYLFENYKLDFGYLIEHTHRIMGFGVGALVAVLTLGIWWSDPRPAARWVGLAGLVALLAGFGDFHRGLMDQRGVPTAEIRLPVAAVGTTLGGLLVALGVAVSGCLSGTRGWGLRFVALAGLVAVMTQGLLGGFRVLLNELVGTDLAAVHGTFAQVVFGLLASLVILTGRPKPTLHDGGATGLLGWSVGLVALLYVQVAWGAVVRHDPIPLALRMHFLTAFLATGVAVWVLSGVWTHPGAKASLGCLPRVLTGLLAVQLILGVEAWMEKFGSYTLPELVPITEWNAAIRTLHALVGSGLVAAAVMTAVRLKQAMGAGCCWLSGSGDKA
jgi:heme A synthase